MRPLLKKLFLDLCVAKYSWPMGDLFQDRLWILNSAPSADVEIVGEAHCATVTYLEAAPTPPVGMCSLPASSEDSQTQLEDTSYSHRNQKGLPVASIRPSDVWNIQSVGTKLMDKEDPLWTTSALNSCPSEHILGIIVGQRGKTYSGETMGRGCKHGEECTLNPLYSFCCC